MVDHGTWEEIAGGGAMVGGVGTESAQDTPVKVHPIESLTPYQNRLVKWMVRSAVMLAT